MKRSLLLAGGGMRVAWQTGVVRALEEEGLEFTHLDGTSGGILTTAMLLSGLSPAEMGRRWSDLPVRAFSSPLRLRDYLKGPWNWPGLTDTDGIRKTVIPHLGIEVAKVRASSRAGTFNVCDFDRKTCVAVPNTEIDVDLLAAGMSLAAVTAPLQRDGRTWTDAVWIKDANLTEALDRGAEEVWLLWCIGNSPSWRGGALEQYVHMIEMSANGALFAELDTARRSGREFVLHVVAPRFPLPLDPELFTGRISCDTLVAMGYRDARDYLGQRSPTGVAKDHTCTRMTDPGPGVRATLRLSGQDLHATVTVELPLPESGAPTAARLVGHIDHAPWGDRVLLAAGALNVADGQVRLTGEIRVAGQARTVEILRDQGGGVGPDTWLGEGPAQLLLDGVPVGPLEVRGLDAVRTFTSFEPVGVRGLLPRAQVLLRLLRNRR